MIYMSIVLSKISYFLNAPSVGPLCIGHFSILAIIFSFWPEWLSLIWETNVFLLFCFSVPPMGGRTHNVAKQKDVALENFGQTHSCSSNPQKKLHFVGSTSKRLFKGFYLVDLVISLTI